MARLAELGIRLEITLVAHLDQAALNELHGLANALMSESASHFEHHARSNDVVHCFRDPNGALLGFQFWRSGDVPNAATPTRFVLGGKLRIVPAARRRGLHLVAGLQVLRDELAAHPNHALVRLANVSIFGFVTIARRLSNYFWLDAACGRPELLALTTQLCQQSDFVFDPTRGFVQVGIAIPRATLDAYPTDFWNLPQTRAYALRNPHYATNGTYLAMAFDVDELNLQALTNGTHAALRSALQV